MPIHVPREMHSDDKETTVAMVSNMLQKSTLHESDFYNVIGNRG